MKSMKITSKIWYFLIIKFEFEELKIFKDTISLAVAMNTFVSSLWKYIFQHIRILRLQKLSFQALLAMETSNNINPIFYGFFKQLLRIPHLKESIDCLRPGAHERLYISPCSSKISVILLFTLNPIALIEWKYIYRKQWLRPFIRFF